MLGERGCERATDHKSKWIKNFSQLFWVSGVYLSAVEDVEV